MNWAWEQALPPSSKLILMALADAANEEGRCWPRIRIIASKCCVADRTVQRILRAFEESGLLLVVRRFSAHGAQLSNDYWLGLPSAPVKMSPPSRTAEPGDAHATPGATPLSQGGGDSNMSPLEPPTVPTIKQQQQRDLRPYTGDLELPSRLSQAEKDAALAMLSGISNPEAQILLDELTGVLETGSTIKTTPIRWFRALVSRHRAGAFVPLSGIKVSERRERRRIPAAEVSEEPRNPASPETARVHTTQLANFLRVKI
jgi:hypothetical protein